MAASLAVRAHAVCASVVCVITSVSCVLLSGYSRRHPWSPLRAPSHFGTLQSNNQLLFKVHLISSLLPPHHDVYYVNLTS